MDTGKDYYAILGVMPEAEPEIIRAVYLALAKKYHPDNQRGWALGQSRRPTAGTSW